MNGAETSSVEFNSTRGWLLEGDNRDNAGFGVDTSFGFRECELWAAVRLADAKNAKRRKAIGLYDSRNAHRDERAI